MTYIDKTLKCDQCGSGFVFTADEQLFFASKGFVNEPKRCKVCKVSRYKGRRVLRQL